MKAPAEVPEHSAEENAFNKKHTSQLRSCVFHESKSLRNSFWLARTRLDFQNLWKTHFLLRKQWPRCFLVCLCVCLFFSSPF